MGCRARSAIFEVSIRGRLSGHVPDAAEEKNFFHFYLSKMVLTSGTVTFPPIPQINKWFRGEFYEHHLEYSFLSYFTAAFKVKFCFKILFQLRDLYKEQP